MEIKAIFVFPGRGVARLRKLVLPGLGRMLWLTCSSELWWVEGRAQQELRTGVTSYSWC